jgi:ribulose-bisphosphate carboxylase large chain
MTRAAGRDAARRLARLEDIHQIQNSRFEARISYTSGVLGHTCAELLNLVFGISSLKPGVRVVHLDLPDAYLGRWTGPRFGRVRLRARLGVPDRPLVCGVLKPVGATPVQLADIAYQCALGGLDLVKDDQGFGNQPHCPFQDRVERCADAIARATRETGRACLYAPHVTGGPSELHRQSRLAKRAGAGALLVCPGLVGFDVIRELAQDRELALPVLSHPALLGVFTVHPDSGIAPSVMYGQLPRLAGADITIYPAFGGPYPIGKEDCRRIIEAVSSPWSRLKPIFPTAAGRVRRERLAAFRAFYGSELVVVVGSELYRRGTRIAANCRALVNALEETT